MAKKKTSFWTPARQKVYQSLKTESPEEVYDDDYLAENIVDARTDFEKAVKVYKNYVGSSETPEERLRRINQFRCGGW